MKLSVFEYFRQNIPNCLLESNILTVYSQIGFPAQPGSNLRQRFLVVKSDSLKSTLSALFPESFYINNVSDSDYTLDYVRAILYWRKKPALDTVTITYRVFPFALNPSIQRMNYDSVMNNFYVDTTDHQYWTYEYAKRHF